MKIISKILSLTMPYMCEELWEMMGNADFVSNAIWGDFNERYINNDIESEFDYISDVRTDILNIQKIVSSSELSKLYLYTASSWKYKALKIVISKEGNFNRNMKDKDYFYSLL